MKRSYFNMIEVMLALGVVAIGVVSILALIPAGLNSTRDAMAETYAAAAAEQLLHSIRYTLEQSTANWNEWVNPAAPVDWDAKPGTAPDYPELTLNTGLTGAGAFGGSTRGAVHEQTPYHVYKLVAFRDADDDGEYDGPTATPPEPPDFQCVAAVWGEQVSLPDGSLVSWAVATRVNVEVSWPGELPYARRYKRVYSLEVFHARD